MSITLSFLAYISTNHSCWDALLPPFLLWQAQMPLILSIVTSCFYWILGPISPKKLYRLFAFPFAPWCKDGRRCRCNLLKPYMSDLVLETMLGLISLKSRRPCLLALDTVSQLLLSDLLIPDRKLGTFDHKPFHLLQGYIFSNNTPLTYKNGLDE